MALNLNTLKPSAIVHVNELTIEDKDKNQISKDKLPGTLNTLV